MNLVVFGTSLLWGQGLEDADKIHNVLARKIEKCLPDEVVRVTLLAHSGASTGYKPDGSVDTKREPRLHGEVPTLYPTILQEIEEFDDQGMASDAVDIILLDAGANDVHITSVLDPVTTPDHIEKAVQLYCRQHMELLVDKLLTKFKNARVVITAYYEFITEQSEEDYIRAMLKAFGKLPAGFLADAIFGVATGLIKRRLLANCDTFAQQSLIAFEEVADLLNKRYGCQRVLIASLDMKPDNAAFAADPWLYGINDDLSPQDPLAGVRQAACHAAGSSRTVVLFCEKASAGHPNPKGAKAFAEVIFKLLWRADNTDACRALHLPLNDR